MGLFCPAPVLGAGVPYPSAAEIPLLLLPPPHRGSGQPISRPCPSCWSPCGCCFALLVIKRRCSETSGGSPGRRFCNFHVFAGRRPHSVALLRHLGCRASCLRATSPPGAVSPPGTVSPPGAAAPPRAHVVISPSKDSYRIGLESTHITSFCFNYFFKYSISKYSHVLGYWGLRLPRRNLGGDAV